MKGSLTFVGIVVGTLIAASFGAVLLAFILYWLLRLYMWAIDALENL